MLTDIIKITEKTFNEFIPNNLALRSPKNIYDVSRSLSVMIDCLEILSEHYLALDFTEHKLQNSSFGKPSDKWRWFLNEDLDQLNKSIKNYLQNISNVQVMRDCAPATDYLSTIYNPKVYYAFVRDKYNVGYIEQCSFFLISLTLMTEMNNKNYDIEKQNKFNLSTYEDRLTLQKNLRKKRVILQNMSENVKNYISSNYTIEDIL